MNIAKLISTRNKYSMKRFVSSRFTYIVIKKQSSKVKTKPEERLKRGTAQDLGVISNGEFRIIIKEQGFEMIYITKRSERVKSHF